MMPLGEGQQEGLKKGRLAMALSLLPGLLFPVLMIVYCLAGRTIAPVEQLYNRNYLPWDTYSEPEGLWRFMHGTQLRGDLLFQFPYDVDEVLDARADGGQNYSFQTTFGRRIETTYNQSRGLAIPLAGWFRDAGVEAKRSIFYAINLSWGMWAAVYFYLLWLTVWLWYRNPVFAAVAGVLVNPAVFWTSMESGLLGIGGLTIVPLAVTLLWYTRQEHRSGKHVVAFYAGAILVALFSSWMVMASSWWNLLMYLPVVGLFFAPACWKLIGFRRCLLLTAALALPILVDSGYLLKTIDHLQESNKLLGEPTALRDRSYAPFPLMMVIDRSLPHYFASQVLEGTALRVYYVLVNSSSAFAGLALTLGALAGAWKLKPRWLLLGLLLVLLYFMGPLHVILAWIFPTPFATESSSRMGIILYACLAFLSLHGFRWLSAHRMHWPALTRLLGILSIYYLVGFVIIAVNLRQFYLAAALELLAIVLLIPFLKGVRPSNIRHRWIMSAFLLLLLPVMRLFIGPGWLVAPAQRIDRAILPAETVASVAQNLSKVPQPAVGALIDVPGDNVTFHHNFFQDLSVNSSQSYRNPYHFAYPYLYWRAWTHQYPNSGGITPKETLEELRFYIRDDSMSAFVVDEEISPVLERLWDLSGVNLLATPAGADYAHFNWKPVYGMNSGDFALWQRERPFSPFRVLSEFAIVDSPQEALDRVFHPAFKPEHQAVIYRDDESKLSSVAGAQGEVRRARVSHGQAVITTSGSGLLVTNLTFSRHLRILNKATGEPIPTVIYNFAFLAGVLPPDAGEAETWEVIYESPTAEELLREHILRRNKTSPHYLPIPLTNTTETSG